MSSENGKITYRSLSDCLEKQYPNRPIRLNMLDELLTLLLQFEVDTIDEIDRMIDRTKDAVKLFETNNPPDIGDKQYSATAMATLSVALLRLNDGSFAPKTSAFGTHKLREKLAEYQEYILPEDPEPNK